MHLGEDFSLAFEKIHTKELHKTPPGKIPRGSLVRVGECGDQLVISYGNAHPGRWCGKGLFIGVGN